jgi:MoaA/NifB/PqqE/SkfB family radical SAM enzyme
VIKAMEFQLSYACTQACVFCSEAESLEEFGDAPVTSREIARVLATKRREGVERVAFAGAGEPSLHPHFLGALKAARELGYRTAVVSNGWGLAEPALAAAALPLIDELTLSLHGDSAALHEKSTRTPGGFARLLRAFAHARARPSVFLATNTVVTTENAGRAEAIARFALGLGGVRRVQLSQLVPEGRGADRYAERALPHSWWREAVPALAGLAAAAGAELWLDGLPLCAVPEHRGSHKNLHLEPVVSVDRARDGGEPVLAETVNRRPGAQKGRLKLPACGDCSEGARCDGVFASHAEAFGTDDLRPYGGAPAPGLGGEVDTLSDGWRNFYCDQDFADACRPLDWDLAKTLIVEYSDRECFYSEPSRSFGKWSFLDYPFEQPLRHGLGLGASERSVAAEIGEREIVMGTSPTMDGLVDEVRRRAGGAEFVLVNKLCTPLVMGDDLDGLSRRCAQACGGAAAEVSMNDLVQMNSVEACLRAVLARGGDAPGDPAAVNLFHFPRRFREEAVLPLLRDLGLRAGVCLYPEMDLAALKDIPKAARHVFCERASDLGDKIHALLGEGSGEVSTAPAAYGVAGTRACLAAIAAAAGRTAGFEEAWAARLEAFLPAWEKGRAEASAFRLAFVVSAETLPRLYELRFGQGAPVLALVLEMGFGVDLLYYGAGPAPAAPPGTRLAAFRTPAELERALREGEFTAVYSDMFFDDRVTRAGKSRFSSRFFEMGLEGALRSLERLLSACRTPFFARYAAHLPGGRDA